MFETMLPGTAVNMALRVYTYPLSMSLVLFPLSCVFTQLFADFHALAVTHIIKPSTLIDVLILFNSQLTITMSLVLLPFSSICHLVLIVEVCTKSLFQTTY